MTPIEALQDMERLVKQVIASPPEIRTLVWWAVAEIDRQIAAKRNPTLHAMMEAVPPALMRDIVNDQRRGVAAPASMASTPDAPPSPERRGTGWQQDHGFPDRSRDFELMDRIVESQVGGPNDTRKLR
jgi:hypothetical protein